MNRKCARTVVTHAEAIGGSEIESVSATNDCVNTIQNISHLALRFLQIFWGIHNSTASLLISIFP